MKNYSGRTQRKYGSRLIAGERQLIYWSTMEAGRQLSITDACRHTMTATELKSRQKYFEQFPRNCFKI